MSRPFNLFLVIFMTSNLIFGQSNATTEKAAMDVFNNLVLAYGNAKTPPKLKIIENQNSPAIYYPSPIPTISLDKGLLSICNSLGENSTNALSVVIAHELAHYYTDHTFCADFAFASRKDNPELSGRLKLLSKTKAEKLAIEIEADQKGLFYACIAGYKPFNMYPKLLDAIYASYNLRDTNNGYPTKQERKEINLMAQKKVNLEYNIFLEGIEANKNEDYDKAIECFESLNRFFPSRENYNNLGVAKTRKALLLKVPTSEDYKYPKRFEYPLEIDYNSRLNQEVTRGLDDDSDMMQQLLKSAQKDFEKAILLDPSYTKGYINLACVYDLLENYYLAIGTINRLPINQKNTKDARRIYAIAHYHADMEDKAEVIWKKLKM